MYDVTMQSSRAVPWYAEALPQELDRLVDLAWEPGWAPMALGELVGLCHQLRDGHDHDDWLNIRAMLRAHPINRLMREDPLVFHADKPDAVLRDLLMGHPDAEALIAGTSRAGRDLFAASRSFGWMATLAARDAYLGRMVDAVAIEHPGAEILTLGGGHLREAWGVGAPASLRRWAVVALDAGRRGAMRNDLPAGLPLQPLRCSLRSFTRRPYGRGCFDLVCLPAVPDGWDTAMVSDLLSAAFCVLKPGGRLLICAPAEAPAEAAWMEVFMGLTPTWRSIHEMEMMLGRIPAAECADRRVFHSLDGRMVHAILKRRG
jgi:SAM-dependent methyltransferase